MWYFPLLVWCCLLIAGTVPLYAVGRDTVFESTVLQELQQKAPSAVEAFRSATVASDSGNTEAAITLYRMVLTEAPGFDHAQRRLGHLLASVGRLDEASALLDSALTVRRSPENLFGVAYFLAVLDTREGDPTTRYLSALQHIREAIQHPAYEPDVHYPALYAQCALQSGREDDFRNAVTLLAVQHPGEMNTHYFSAIQAVIDEDWTTAEDEIGRAVEKGLDPTVAQSFLDSGVGSRASVWRYTYYGLSLLAVWAVGLLVLFFLGKFCSYRMLRLIDAADPHVASGAGEGALRQFYRTLISIAGVYYYISLPIVAGATLAAVAGVNYAAFAAGRFPVKLLFFIDIGALITVTMMIRTVFMKPESQDPGRVLTPEEAPGLWNLAREVAEQVGTRPIDEIRVLPGTELAVYERGTARERVQDRAHRILLLGVGVLDGFEQHAFRSVLAHEYGHFSHRDTAGGDIALRVNNTMSNLMVAMVEGRQAVWWNPGFLFLRVYSFLFRRISHGASRLQEVQADRLAVLKYGFQSFKAGLEHVIHRSVEFHTLAVHELSRAQQEQRMPLNLYELRAGQSNEQERALLEEQIQEALTAETTEDDTHPSPTERLRLAATIRDKSSRPVSGMVWDLFTSREVLVAEMDQLIRRSLHSQQSVAAE